MFKTAARLASLLIAIAGFGLAQPVLADSEIDISTPAWTNHALRLYEGPNERYQIRTVLPGGVSVHVDRCSQLWCRIHAGREHGYVFLYSLSFGQGPNSIWWPPEARHPGVHYDWTTERSRPRF